MISPRQQWIIIVLVTLLALVALTSLFVGPSPVEWRDLAQAIGLFERRNLDPTVRFIILDIRLPRTLAALTVGGALGLSGVLLQTILKNSLAEPYTLGVSGGATLGAVVALLFSPTSQSLALALGAFVGCWCIATLLLALLKSGRVNESRGLILTGVMLSLFCGSFVSILFSEFEPTQLQKAMSWMIGQVGTTRDGLAFTLGIVLIGFLIFWIFHARRLDHFLVGEDLARTLGTSPLRLRYEVIITVACLTSLSVAVAGLMGFVGLISPHLAYLLLRTRRHFSTLIASVLIGGILLASADSFGRWLGGDREIPAGSVVALIGAPILIFLLMRPVRSRFSGDS